MRKAVRRFAQGVTVVATALIIVACGGGFDDDVAPATVDVITSAAAPDETSAATCWNVPDEEIAQIVADHFGDELDDVQVDEDGVCEWSARGDDASYAYLYPDAADHITVREFARVNGGEVRELSETAAAVHQREAGYARWRAGGHEMGLEVGGAALSDDDMGEALARLVELFIEHNV